MYASQVSSVLQSSLSLSLSLSLPLSQQRKLVQQGDSEDYVQ